MFEKHSKNYFKLFKQLILLYLKIDMFYLIIIFIHNKKN